MKAEFGWSMSTSLATLFHLLIPGGGGRMKNTLESDLKHFLGKEATFRVGQLEAIEELVTRKNRILVIQRTGWGKSVVYFLTTKIAILKLLSNDQDEHVRKAVNENENWLTHGEESKS